MRTAVVPVKEKAGLLAAVSLVLLPTVVIAQEQALGDAMERRGAGEDIIVTGSRSLSTLDVPTATPVQVLAEDELAHRRQGGLGETLAGLPGVHLDNFGGGASRPVIRGQTVPRIEILSDGANLFDVSSLSPDHAITTDPLLLDGIEVLRGPAATRYGGNAVNGAINLIDGKVPKALPSGRIDATTELRYGTGDREKTLVGRATAGFGALAVHAEGARRRSADYDIPDAYGSDTLRDSFANSSSYAVGASWITPTGYLGAAYSRFEADYGLPGHSHEGFRCHTHPGGPTGNGYLHCDSFGGDRPYDPTIDANDTAFIRLGSTRADVRGDYDDLLPGLAHARLRLSYTDYKHDEVDGGLYDGIVFSRFSNEVYDGRVELTHAPVLGLTGMLGGQYTRSTFRGLDLQVGERTLAPYVTDDYGIFLSERRSFGAFDVELAARKDWRRTHVSYSRELYKSRETIALDEVWLRAGMTTEADIAFVENRNKASHPLLYPTTKASPFSASISAAWNISDDFSASLQLSRSERAPTVREIYNNNNSLATNSREVGLIRGPRGLPIYSDVIETARAINLTLRKTQVATRFEIGLFHQDIDDYIYARDIVGTELTSGAVFRYLKYTPVDSTFTGIDGQISHRFGPSSQVTVFGDYVRARMKNRAAEDLCRRIDNRPGFDDKVPLALKYECTPGNTNLPRIPPGRLGARYEGDFGSLHGDLEYYRTFGQDRIAAYETVTPAYDMLNATLAYRFDIGGAKSVEVYLRATNLLDELAYAHTSFVKNQSPLRGRNIVLGMRHQFGSDGTGPSYVSRPFSLDHAGDAVDWSGVYAGFHVGGGFGKTWGTTTTGDGTPDARADAESADRTFASPLPGVQGGWNYQLPGGVVIGGQADWAKSFFRGTQDTLATEGALPGTGELQARTRYDVEWTGGLKARIGYAAGRLLPYATGGLALARETQRRDQYRAVPASDEEEFGPLTVVHRRDKASATRTGFTLGGGTEYALSSRLSILGEYAYNRFGRQNFRFRDAGAGVGKDFIRREIVGYDVFPAPIPPDDPLCADPGYADACVEQRFPIMDETEVTGTSSVRNGRRAANRLEYHAFRIGLNYRF